MIRETTLELEFEINSVIQMHSQILPLTSTVCLIILALTANQRFLNQSVFILN